MAQLKRLDFELDIKSNIYYFADKNRIERLLDNLLSNAIKYARKETKIQILLDKNFCVIQDEGKGMSKEELSKIFLRYSRFDKSQGGFGIGYNIVKSIADAYSIDIEIESKLGIGTKVTLKW
jgi:two-component system OmpR family sensor kinase